MTAQPAGGSTRRRRRTLFTGVTTAGVAAAGLALVLAPQANAAQVHTQARCSPGTCSKTFSVVNDTGNLDAKVDGWTNPYYDQGGPWVGSHPSEGDILKPAGTHTWDLWYPQGSNESVVTYSLTDTRTSLPRGKVKIDMATIAGNHGSASCTYVDGPPVSCAATVDPVTASVTVNLKPNV